MQCKPFYKDKASINRKQENDLNDYMLGGEVEVGVAVGRDATGGGEAAAPHDGGNGGCGIVATVRNVDVDRGVDIAPHKVVANADVAFLRHLSPIALNLPHEGDAPHVVEAGIAPRR